MRLGPDTTVATLLDLGDAVLGLTPFHDGLAGCSLGTYCTVHTQGDMGNGKSTANQELSCDGRLCRLNTIADDVLLRQKFLVRKLNELANDLDKQQRKIRKAKVGLSTSSAVGGLMAATGFGLSFVTFGASLALTYIGTGVSIASSVGTVATNIAEKIIKRKKVHEASAAVKAYTRAVQQFAPILEYFCEGLATPIDRERMRQILIDTRIASNNILVSEVRPGDKLCSACAKGNRILAATVRVREVMADMEEEDDLLQAGLDGGHWTAGTVSDVSTFGKGAFRAFQQAARPIRIGDVALTGVGIVLDIGSIIYYSIKLSNKQPSDVAILIRRLAEALDFQTVK